MKHLRWIAVALIFFVLSVCLVAWPDWQELRRSKAWNVARVDATQGTLNGINVFIESSPAMILKGFEDRAVIYVRLGLVGNTEILKKWLTCNVSLTDSQGRTWLPLTNTVGYEIMKLLGDPKKNEVSCSQSLTRETESDQVPKMSGQAFLVPSTVLNDLRLQVSGMKTLPNAISLSFKPVLRSQP